MIRHIRQVTFWETCSTAFLTDMNDEAWMICEICKGPIYYGEPVVSWENGWAHRFVTWCDHYKKAIIEYDQKLAKELGLNLE
jgi:hypothetical protein